MTAPTSPSSPAPSSEEEIPAGAFSEWLATFRRALQGGEGMDVPCGSCNACCRSSMFIHVERSERESLRAIPPKLLFSAPGMPKGHKVMGFDGQGRCPMLVEEGCTIYAHRPMACRRFDCRILAAAGLDAGGEGRALITQRVLRWRFSYPGAQDEADHLAVQAAARFVRENASAFPGGAVPADPVALALVAIKSYAVFLPGGAPARVPATLAQEVVALCRLFDGDQARREPSR